MRWSIVHKFTACISGLVILTTILLSWSFIRYENEQAKEMLKEKGAILARILAYNSEYGIMAENKELLSGLLSIVMKEKDVVYCLIYDAKGNTLAEESKAGKFESRDKQVVSVDKLLILPYPAKEGFWCDVYFPVKIAKIPAAREEIGFGLVEKEHPGEEKIGVVRVGISLRSMEQAMDRVKRTIILLTLIAVLMGIGTIYFLTQRIISPLKQLVTASKKIGNGDLTYRVKATTHDETRDLADEFNRMTERLSDSYSYLEDKVAERTEALAKAEEEFRLVFETAKDAILWADQRTGLITKCNKAAELLLEKERNEIEGAHQRTIHPPEKAEYYAEMFRKHIEQKGWADDEAEVITKSGRIIPVNITTSVTLIKGEPIIQGILHDITERKEMHRKLVEVEKLAAVSQIAAEAAHEIKNPLQVMKTGLYYLKMVTNKEETNVQETIQQMDNAIGRTTGFINNLLNFSRPPQLNTANCQINELIAGAIKELPDEVLSDIEVTQNLSSGLPEISVDSDRLRQVIINLVKNAAEAMGEVRSKKLEVRSKKEGEFVKISISDTGKGIPKEDMGKVFDPFYTTRGKGIGLGLVICQRLIEAHQGRIEVESEVGVGTTFVVQLPI